MGALVASAMVGNADTMAELGSVPLGPCHGPWSERRQWMVGRASGAFFASVHICNSCRYNEPYISSRRDGTWTRTLYPVEYNALE